MAAFTPPLMTAGFTNPSWARALSKIFWKRMLAAAEHRLGCAPQWERAVKPDWISAHTERYCSTSGVSGASMLVDAKGSSVAAGTAL
jgi:hypothetical protein